MSERGHEILTLSGARVSLYAPKPSDIRLSDIDNALNEIPRFCGHAGDLTVAQHSILVANIVCLCYPGRSGLEIKRLRLEALLHDAHEAYIGDIPGPVCALLGAPLERIKHRLDEAIYRAMGAWPRRYADEVARADEEALRIEFHHCHGGVGDECPMCPCDLPDERTRKQLIAAVRLLDWESQVTAALAWPATTGVRGRREDEPNG